MLLLLLRWDTGKVRDRFGGMARLKSGLNCKGCVIMHKLQVDHAIITIITM